MAIQKHARDLLFFELLISRRALQAPVPTLEMLLPLWQHAKDDLDFPARQFENGQVTAVIRDFAVDNENETATFLIEVSDKAAPNSTYLDHQQRTARHIKKEAPEGNGFSAHVVISFRERLDRINTYLTLVEAIPAVSIKHIQSLLNAAIRYVCSKPEGSPFTYVRPGGGKKVEGYTPHILLTGCPSERFLQDIESGTINGLRLVAPKTHETFGAGNYLKLDELAVSVKVSKDIPRGERWDTILTGITAKKHDFPTARIYFQPEDDGKSFHVDIDVETGNVIGQAYVKSRRLINIDPLMETSAPESIVTHFELLVKNLLIRERG